MHQSCATVVLTGLLTGVAAGQVITNPGGPGGAPGAGEPTIDPWVEQLVPNPDDPRYQAFVEQTRLRKAKERELVRFRAQYFRSNAGVEQRQIGLALMRERYDDPALYPLILDVFERSKPEVKAGIYDMFVDAASAEGDTTLAWCAVHEREEESRSSARDRLFARVAEAGAIAPGVEHVIAAGLRQDRDAPVIAAAGIAENLQMLQMVPLMIAGQVTGASTGVGEGDGNLGWIVIGQQQAFVSDLQPVVSDSAVGFDPTLGVVTEGVVLEVNDAHVITYRTEVFYSLQRMTSAAIGSPTGSWGMDQPKWWAWYEAEWKPWMASRAPEAGAARTDG